MGAALWPALLLIPRSNSRWALMHRAARAAFRLMGIRLDVTGTWPKTTGVVIVSNHASYLDGLALAAVTPGEPAFIAKKELDPQFFAGPFLRQLGALFVDRADPEGGVEDVNALDAAKLKDAPSPRGTLRGTGSSHSASAPSSSRRQIPAPCR
jgi:1-acyl-sn-glycerol-3-phosphate acyltransferase